MEIDVAHVEYNNATLCLLSVVHTCFFRHWLWFSRHSQKRSTEGFCQYTLHQQSNLLVSYRLHTPGIKHYNLPVRWTMERECASVHWYVHKKFIPTCIDNTMWTFVLWCNHILCDQIQLKGELDCSVRYDRDSWQNQQLYRWSRLSPFVQMHCRELYTHVSPSQMLPWEELEQFSILRTWTGNWTGMKSA